MAKRFTIGFGIGLLIFLGINLLAAHLRSTCGLLAIFRLDPCYDDIVGAGWPLQFYEEGGFFFHLEFNPVFLLINLWIGSLFALGCGWRAAHWKKPLSK